MSTAAPQPLNIPLADLSGVGSERAAQLLRLDLRTVGDALLHRPRRYEDRRNFRRIAELQLNDPAIICGKIIAAGLRRFRDRRRSVVEVIIDDGSARLHCRWWNLPFMEKYFKTGEELVVFGKPNSLRPRTMDHPETEVIQALETSLHLNRVVPIYPLTEGLPQRWLRSFLWRVVEQFASAMEEPHPDLALPAGLPARAEAIRRLHFPDELAEKDLAIRRLAYDEYVEMQLAIQRRRHNLQRAATARPCAGDNRWIKPFLAGLGYPLTEAQTRVLREMRHDLAGPRPMRRLLQGDVGSGKTVVAACAALMALESGTTVVLMAPTEILAEQHARNFRRWFEPLDIAVELHTSSVKTIADRRQESLPLHTARFFVGTHALLQESFAPENLGLVIIDEQHKFGVAQRGQLLRKGAYPHLLVMTATPIPRTLGLTLYGDLDISVLDQLPPGRGRIKTFVRERASLPKVWTFLRDQLAAGRQGYVVYARLEEADSAAGIKALTKEWHELEDTFAPWRTALLHGQLPAEDKETVMTEFRNGAIHVLVATSVIEVGLDVPNATVMVIENAEQFGLAQLHQLRGRIGRGAEDSYCILVSSGKTDDARQRLKIMEETTDGFRIAEADLELRGPGQMLGWEQSGAPPLRFGDLAADRALIEQARAAVREYFKSK